MLRTCILVVFIFFLATRVNSQEVSDRKVVPVISTKLNTEFSPTISADGRLMIFESDVDKKKGWELFESRLDDTGNWTPPASIKSINEKCNFLAGPSLSHDGNILYFTAFIENVTQSEDIYYSERIEGNNWSEPKSIGPPINTDTGYEGFPSISADGNSLYFIRVNGFNVYDKKNKENCFVIFASDRQADGTWGEPYELPAPVNTGCERDPKIMADNHTLIFSSIREGGKGKYDLYQTRKQIDGNWAEPVPLDFINAAESDQSPCISASGEVIFFYSLKDIYSVTIPERYRQRINVTVMGYVRSEKNQSPVKAQIHVRELNSSNDFQLESSLVDGLYSLVLSAGKKYSVEFSNENYFTEIVDMDFENQGQYLEVKKNISLKSEYVVNLSIEDQDLKTPLNAWLTVRGSGEVFNDSLRGNQYPFRLTLEAGKNYELKAAAPSFPEFTESWKFNPLTFTAEMTHTLYLTHEKVQYTADVTNIVSSQKTKLKVYFNNEKVDEVIVADAGDVVYLRKGDRYQVMTASDKGFFFSSETIVAGTGESDAKGGYRINLIIVPIEEGAQLTLEHITFATNSADLNRTSLVELDRVIELMQKNPTLKIEISAHTDDVGNSTYNLKLSQKRALGVLNYLVKNGTDSKRMKSAGLGKNKPLLPNTSEENRAKNRRVELRVLKF